MTTYDLVIAHRVCPALSATATGFADKLTMVKACSESLWKALLFTEKRIKLLVVLDGCSPDYRSALQKIFDDPTNRIGVVFVDTPAIGNFATYAKQCELLREEAADADYLYFSEDDYLYEPEAFTAMMEMLVNTDVDFVTPLDHPDRYKLPEVLSVQNKDIRISRYRHWMRTATTCCTFMTKRSVFIKAFPLIKVYGQGAMDGTLWLGITKTAVRSPFRLLVALGFLLFTRKPSFWRIMPLCAWKHFRHRILTTRAYSLYQPIPTLAVHLSSQSISPLSAYDTDAAVVGRFALRKENPDV